MKKLVAALIGITTALSPLSTFAQAEGASLSERAKSLSQKVLEASGATSIQYAIMDNGKIVLSDASGVYDKTTNNPVTKNNMYGIGSSSKMFATAAIMQLVDKGKVVLDDPLTKYIPEFKMADDRYKQITIRMLLNHSSGMYGTHYNNGFLLNDNDTYNHDTLLEKLKEDRLKADPGFFSEYCNDGFTLAEIVVERVSGVTYTDYLEQNLFQPMGIKNIKTPLSAFDRGQLARTYGAFFEQATPIENTMLIGSGGIYATAEDLCTFAKVLMGDVPNVLSKKATEAMGQEEYKNGMWVDDHGSNIFGYGLGWDTVHVDLFAQNNIQALSKGGDALLYHTSLVVIPEHHISMAVCSSSGSSMFAQIFGNNILQEYLKEKNIIQEDVKEKTFEVPVKADMPKEIESYSGVYADVMGQHEIQIKNGEVQLPVIGSGIPPQKYVYTKSGDFVSLDGKASARFVIAKDGNTYLQTNTLIELPVIGSLTNIAFQYQKLEPNKLSPEILHAWEQRTSEKYFVVNEKASSEFMVYGSVVTSLVLNDNFDNGYAFSGAKIVDKDYAVNTLKFREGTDVKFFTQNGIEYAKSRSFVYIGENDIHNMYGGLESICTIQSDGYARYYNIGSDVQGKTMTVTIPDKSSYIVFDEKGNCVNYTTITGNTTTKLPQGGKIAFMGKVGDVFRITLQ